MRLPQIDPLRRSSQASPRSCFRSMRSEAAARAAGPARLMPETANAARGALLYDQWWSETGAPAPSSTHPAYPAAPGGTQTGSTTWRCAECHGWDYAGASGAYAAGAHRTGPGRPREREEPAAGPLRRHPGLGTPHDFGAKLRPADVWDLVAFVKAGATDTRPWICPTGAAKGDARTGGPLFTASCAGCHGADGKAFELEGGKGLGELARIDPWRTLHAIRWGVAGSAMPSMWAEGLSERGAVRPPRVRPIAHGGHGGGASPARRPSGDGLVREGHQPHLDDARLRGLPPGFGRHEPVGRPEGLLRAAVRDGESSRSRDAHEQPAPQEALLERRRPRRRPHLRLGPRTPTIRSCCAGSNRALSTTDARPRLAGAP